MNEKILIEGLVSVIIPVYNSEKYVKETIESVLKQTYQNFEIIIVDDCSTDNSCQIIENIDDQRIQLIQLDKNSGVAVARNIAIENAKGQYIAFLDSDGSKGDHILILKKQIKVVIGYVHNHLASLE